MESPVPRQVARRVWEGGCRLRAFRKEGLRAVPLPHPFLLRLFLQHKTNGIISWYWLRLSDGMVRLRLWSQMGAGSFTATRRFNSMTCLVFARNALTPELRGKIMQKPYLVSKNVSVTLHSPKQAPGQKSSRCIKRGGQTTTWSITTGIGRARTGGTAPSEVLRGVLGRTFPEEVLSRAL